MTRKPRTTMDDLQRALSRARLPHLELVKLVGRGYFLKDTSGNYSRISPHPQACTELMSARDMLTYLNGLSHGAAESHRAAEDCSHCKELTSVLKYLKEHAVWADQERT